LPSLARNRFGPARRPKEEAMISTRLKRFLDDNGVGYDVMHHDPAFTAQELSARMHISGYEFVKVVVVKLDGNFALAALPAPLRVNFKSLAQAAGVKKVSLASEQEFQQLFPDCELGAMPPFGNLYNLPTYVEQDVSLSENIVVNAGTHAEAIRLRYADFSRLVRPRLGRFGEPPPVEVAAQKKSARAKARKKAAAKKKKKAKPKKKAKAARKKARPKKKARRKAPARKKKKKTARGRKKAAGKKKPKRRRR
jgi:Ala-tRNA(Pro) deacylase